MSLDERSRVTYASVVCFTGPWVTEYDQDYNLVYRNTETGETSYYNPADGYACSSPFLFSPHNVSVWGRYYPETGEQTWQPNDFSYAGEGYGGYDANAVRIACLDLHSL